MLNRPEPQHPVFRILRVEQGRSMVWLARETGFSHSYVRRVASGGEKGSPRFRRACAALLVMPESELFLGGDGHDGGASGAPQAGANARSSTAVRRVYGTGRLLSTEPDTTGGAAAS